MFLCWIFQLLAQLANSGLTNCGALSVTRMSGIPYSEQSVLEALP